MKTEYNHLTHSYETPDGTTVAAEICEGGSPSDAFRAAAIRAQQRESSTYVRTVIDALYENSDPVSVEAAELLERMEQPEQEPAAWVETREDGSIYWGCETDTVISDDPSWLERPVPVYFAPPPRKPLTDEQIEDLYFDKFSMSELKAFARAIEAAHGIKGEA